MMNEVARNLGGKVYIKDGILVIEEMALSAMLPNCN
jgi:hypothetical protein